jgi:prismane/CO dehydrogenase family protein
VGFPGVKHVTERDYSDIVSQVLPPGPQGCTNSPAKLVVHCVGALLPACLRPTSPHPWQALEMDGFESDEANTRTMTGFGHDAVLGLADTIVKVRPQQCAATAMALWCYRVQAQRRSQSVRPFYTQAVQAGDIKRFFVIGGCDGTEGERSYYTDLARNLPKDTVVLTAGCGKYRFNKVSSCLILRSFPRSAAFFT